MSNKYRGICAGCGVTVYPQEGIWRDGEVWCEMPGIHLGSLITCSTDAERQRVERDRTSEIHRGRSDRSYVSADPIAQERIVAHWRYIDTRNADPIYQAEQTARAEKRMAEDRTWARQGLKRCPRCGGAGRSDRWIATGSTCYECEGHGAISA